MLVLSRKTDEQIVIQVGDQDVVVQVVAIERTKVRLGIIAPPEVPVHREEVLRRVEACEGAIPGEAASASVRHSVDGRR